jgi:hypothetical protein
MSLSPSTNIVSRYQSASTFRKVSSWSIVHCGSFTGLNPVWNA